MRCTQQSWYLIYCSWAWKISSFWPFFQWTLSLMTTDINVGLKKGFREVSYDSFLTTLSCNRPLEPMLPAVGKPCACNENRENHFARMGYLNSPSMILSDQQLLWYACVFPRYTKTKTKQTKNSSNSSEKLLIFFFFFLTNLLIYK